MAGYRHDRTCEPDSSIRCCILFHFFRFDAFTLPERLFRLVERGDGEFRPQGSAGRYAVTEDEGYASIAGLPGKFDRQIRTVTVPFAGYGKCFLAPDQ